MIVDKKSMQAALADDFNQINLNNINLNITTTTVTTAITTTTTTGARVDSASKTTTTGTIVQHTQSNKPTSKNTSQSPFSKRRHTALPHALTMNQQHLCHTQQQQELKSQTDTMEEVIDFELLEQKPILRKSLSTPTFNALEPQHPPKTNEVHIIANSKQQQQHHHHHHHHHYPQHHYQHQQQQQQKQQQQQQHQTSHCQEQRHIFTISNNCNTLSSNTKATIPKTAVAAAPATATTTSNTSSLLEQRATSQRFGCAHYKRKAMFVTPCCNKFYKCRFCHDENESHHFDRKTLTELICSECKTRQKVQDSCQNCGIRFGKYTCLICNLFDDEDKCQYHCVGCGICRIGGRENFFHCKVCNMCLPMQLKIDGHRCVENISRSHCPVCLGDIHTSRIPCHIPDCGHLLHKMCFDQLLNSGHYACPTCQTSLIDMTALWEYLDAQAKLNPVPKKYENKKIQIFCNDCHTASKSNFHFIGLKCLNCGAYNTTHDMKRRISVVTDDSMSA